MPERTGQGKLADSRCGPFREFCKEMYSGQVCPLWSPYSSPRQFHCLTWKNNNSEEVGGYRLPREADGEIATSQIIVPWITVGALSVATLPWAASKSRGSLVPDWKEVRSSQRYPVFRNLDPQPSTVVSICESHLLGQKGKTVTWPVPGQARPRWGHSQSCP